MGAGWSHGRETDPAKQHLLPLNERADRLAERGCSGEPCFLLQRCVYTIGADEPELSANFFNLRRGLEHMRRDVGFGWEKNLLLDVVNAGCGFLGILVGQNAWLMNNTVWVQRSQT